MGPVLPARCRHDSRPVLPGCSRRSDRGREPLPLAAQIPRERRVNRPVTGVIHVVTETVVEVMTVFPPGKVDDGIQADALYRRPGAHRGRDFPTDIAKGRYIACERGRPRDGEKGSRQTIHWFCG